MGYGMALSSFFNPVYVDALIMYGVLLGRRFC
jgi:hypothetical protein